IFGAGSAAGRACPSGSSAIARRLLGAFAFTALMAPDAIFAEDNPISLPELRVIANTPLAPASPRPAATTSAPAATTPARRVVAAPASRAAPPVSREAAPAPVDPGLIDRDKVPANVQTLSASDFEHAKAPDLLDAISRSLPGIALSDQTGNEFQRDLNYRGFVASPGVGTPQGLAVYQNGVRVNEVFGDTVNWDFIPETAINRMTLMPSNPVYGLNALGGALSIEMKNGFTHQGTDSELRGGSFGRRAASVQTGGQAGNLSAYLTADAINDNGWRDYSPSRLRRIYGDLGVRGDQTEFHVTFTGASNNFGAAAATPLQLLNQNWASVYTVPQTGQHSFIPGKCLLPRILAAPRRRERDRCAEFGLRRPRLSVLSGSQRQPRESDWAQRPAGSADGRAGQQHIGRDRPHLDCGEQLRRLCAGGHHGQSSRSRQSLRHRREHRQRPRPVRHHERAGNHQCRSVASRAGRRRLYQPAFRRCRPRRRAREDALYRGLRDGHFRSDVEALCHLRRPLQRRPDRFDRYPGQQRGSQRRSHVQPVQPGDRRDLQDHSECHRLRRLCASQSSTDPAGARLLRSYAALSARQCAGRRSAFDAGRLAHL